MTPSCTRHTRAARVRQDVAPATGGTELLDPNVRLVVGQHRLAARGLVPGRWWLIACLVSGLALAACDPFPVPYEPDRADIEVTVGASGAAHMALFLPTRFHRPDLQRIGRLAAVAAFSPAEHAHSGIDPNGSGNPFVVIDAQTAYSPGARPTFHFDVAALQSVLLAQGVTKVSLRVCAPAVPLTITAVPTPNSLENRCASWDNLTPSGASVVINMHPAPWHWWGEIGLMVVGFVAAGTGVLVFLGKQMTSRRRLLAASLAAFALVVSGVGVATAAARQADNLGVAGNLSGSGLALATWSPLLLVPLGPLSLVLLVITLSTRRPPPRRPVE